MSHTGKTRAMSCSRDTSSTKSSTPCCCNFLKLVRKLLKIRSVRLLGRASGNSCKQKCKYDPLTYSLNFDANGYGNFSDDEDYYYRFYAFSSRFVATSTAATSCPRLVATTSKYQKCHVSLLHKFLAFHFYLPNIQCDTFLPYCSDRSFYLFNFTNSQQTSADKFNLAS